MEIVIAIIDWLHLLATVIWIGAMIILMIVIIPSAKDILHNENTFKDFMKSIGKKMTLLVNISIIILIITGIALGVLVETKSNNWLILFFFFFFFLLIYHFFYTIMIRGY